MGFNVGDKVRIRTDLKGNLAKYCGKEATITYVGKGISKKYYRLAIDNGDCWWAEDSFMTGTATIQIIVDGARVIAKQGDNQGIARCHPDDKFDIATGAKIAIERLELAKVIAKKYPWLTDGGCYYTPYIGAKDENMCEYFIYCGDEYDMAMIKRHLVFQTKEEAIKCSKKMLKAIE